MIKGVIIWERGGKNMKIEGSKGIGNLLKIFLQGCMAIVIIILLLLYNILKIYNLNFDLLVIMIYPCGVCLLMLIHQFIGLFNSLKENNPFCHDNIIRLKRSMLMCFAISLLILAALIFSIFLYDYYTFSFKVCLGFICVLFFGVGTALYILKELFKVAIEYKEENELTI